MSWTRSQMKDHIIDQIIKIIISNKYNDTGYFNNANYQLNLSDFRKTISDSGYIQTGTSVDGNTKNVIYQEDYQQLSSEVDEFIDGLLNCFDTGTVNDLNEPLYYEPQDDWVSNESWIINYKSFTTQTSTGELDEYGQEIQGEITLNEVADIEATHTCPNLGSTPNEFTLPIVTPASLEYDGKTPVLDFLSQIVPLNINKSNIDSTKAQEVLDTTIYELLPGIQTRQERVDRVFSEIADLIAPSTPDFDQDAIPGVDLSWDVGGNLGTDSNIYSDTYDISKLGPNSGYITRLIRHEDSANTDKSLQWLRDSLINPYLQDVDTIIDPDEIDDRPDYSNVSKGYLKLRGLNQGMIIRAETDSTLGLEDYQTDGFTITMWVRFIDKKSGGTLFNYGNPLGNGSDYGFMLETFALGEDDDTGNGSTFGNSYPELFEDTSHARFLRLVVNDNGMIYNSHVGLDGIDRLPAPTLPQAFNKSIGGDDIITSDQVLGYTPVPTDRNEWYFIVANYNPTITEEEKTLNDCEGDSNSCTGQECDPNCVDLKNSPEYWNWNVVPGVPGEYTNNSSEGARCKVEIISKSDLLLARGYKI